MPKITQSPTQQKNQAVTNENKPFRERLRDRYKPSDWVRVINIDDEPVRWTWFPSTAEDTEFTDNGAVRVVSGRKHFTKNYEQIVPGNEEDWVINPGNSEVLQGENADLFIETCGKQFQAKSYIKANGELVTGKAGRSMGWNDGRQQEQLIDKIFIGLEQPRFNSEPERSQTPKEAKRT